MDDLSVGECQRRWKQKSTMCFAIVQHQGSWRELGKNKNQCPKMLPYGSPRPWAAVRLCEWGLQQELVFLGKGVFGAKSSLCFKPVIV